MAGAWALVATVPWARASLVLIRHGEPWIQPDVAPAAWTLSKSGRASAAALRPSLAGFRPAAALSSPEPKARETMALAVDLPIETHVDFAEHQRNDWGFLARDELDRRMAAVFAHPDQSIEGAETALAARQRLHAALAREARRPLAVCTHGTILSLWLAERLGVEAEPLWRSLAFCETFVLDETRHELARLDHVGL